MATIGTGDVQYSLGDQIGTTLHLFSEDGTTQDAPIYTAFGEPVAEVAGGMGEPVGEAGGGTGVPPVTTRYGYAGAWGYGAGAWDGDPACQTWEGDQPAPGGDTWSDCASPLGTPCCDPIAELGWLHVGERYYDPAAGRFVQRDPIGVTGGANVYSYARNLPSLYIDPDGLSVLSATPFRMPRTHVTYVDLVDFDWTSYNPATDPRFGISEAVGIGNEVTLCVAGISTRPAIGIGVAGPVVKSIEAGPDLIRIYAGVQHRRNALEEATSAEEFLDNYEQGHGQFVKPRTSF